MGPGFAIVAYAEDVDLEVARLIDSAATPLASILEPAARLGHGAFRDAVVGAALQRAGVAGVLFAARWGGSGVMLTCLGNRPTACPVESAVAVGLP